MRRLSLVTLAVLAACSFRPPRGIPVRVSGKATVRADVRVRAQGTARVDTVVVPLQNAPVTEFFGIPLADAREVVFVLDVSGSMAETAEGQLATIPVPPPPPPDEQAPAPPADAPPADTPPSATPDPAMTAPSGTSPPPPPAPEAPPPPMGYPPGYPPPSSVPPAAEPMPPAPTPQPQVAMRVPTKLEVAQAELIDAITKLPAGTRINVLIFGDEVDAYAPSLVVIDDTSRADLIGFVRDMRANGATALQPAIRLTFLLNPPRIVLLSDGLGNIGGGPEDIMRDVREAVRGGVRVDAIGIGRGQDRKFLSALAAETGGLYQAL